MPATPAREPLAPTGRGLSPEGPRPADLPPPGGPDAAREAGGPWPPGPADSSGAKVDWTPIAERMPPEGTLVEADSPGGHRLRLKWQGRLWRFEDGSYYLFHTPLYWRPLAEPAPMGREPTPPAAPAVWRKVLGLLGWAVGAGALALAAAGFAAPGLTVGKATFTAALTAVGLALLFGTGRGSARGGSENLR